jgi:hypothetical protein
MNRSRAGHHRQLSEIRVEDDVAGGRGAAAHALHSTEARALHEPRALVLAAGLAAALLVGSAGCASGTWNAEEPSTRDARPTYRFRKPTRVGHLSPVVPRPADSAMANESSTVSDVATTALPATAPVLAGHG